MIKTTKKCPKRDYLLSETMVACFGILCVFLLAGYALYLGIDGTIFGLGTTGIGMIVGYIIKAGVSVERLKKK